MGLSFTVFHSCCLSVSASDATEKASGVTSPWPDTQQPLHSWVGKSAKYNPDSLQILPSHLVLADVVNTLKIPVVGTFEVSEEEGADTRLLGPFGVGRLGQLPAWLPRRGCP